MISLDPCIAISISTSRQLATILRSCNTYLSSEVKVLSCNTGLASSNSRIQVSVSEIARDLIRSLIVYGGKAVLDGMRISCPFGLGVLDDELNRFNTNKRSLTSGMKTRASNKAPLTKKEVALKKLNSNMLKKSK